MSGSMSEISRISNSSILGSCIREAYYGGTAEVYVPTLGLDSEHKVINSGQPNGFYYDVNSLYPFIMTSKDMPLGSIFHVHNPKLENVFGFCLAEIKAPDIPMLLLPVRIKGKNLLTTGE